MRGEYRRPWLKLWALECLEGSIRYQLSAAERGTWYDLLALARICGHEGVIADRDMRPFPRTFIANRLNIAQDLLEATLKKCIAEGRITENEGVLVITNWKTYQSEYERQKPYRQKGQPAETAEGYKNQKYGHMVASTAEDVKRIKRMRGK